MNCETMCFIILFKFLLMLSIGSGSIIWEAYQKSREEWVKNGGCCGPTPPEDFKNCVTQKSRRLSAPFLDFKSISCQCHVTPVITGVPTQPKWLQTLRQCLLTVVEYEEIKEKPFGHVELDIFRALKKGDIGAVKNIVYNHPEKLGKDDQDHTPIMTAVHFERMDAFNFLVCHTCNLHDLDSYDNNIFHGACMTGSLDIVKRLISLRIFNLERIGKYGRTALLMAIRYGHIDVAELLIRAGCNVMAVDTWGNNLLHIACKRRTLTTIKWVMGKRIFSMECRDFFGRTPLLVAARKGSVKVCEYLIKLHADVNAVDENGDNWLHLIFANKIADRVREKLMEYFRRKGYIKL